MTSQIKTVLLLALLSAIIIGLGGIMGGRTGIIIAFVIAMIMNVGSYWYSDKIVLSMYQARELSEDEAPPAAPHGGRACRQRRHPQAPRLCHP